MNLEDLYLQAKQGLESARKALVSLTDGLKSTENTDFAEVMKVATEVSKAESALALLAKSWSEAAAQQQAEGVYDDLPLLKETQLYNEQWKSPEDLGTAVTFNFDKFLPEEDSQ